MPALAQAFGPARGRRPKAFKGGSRGPLTRRRREGAAYGDFDDRCGAEAPKIRPVAPALAPAAQAQDGPLGMRGVRMEPTEVVGDRGDDAPRKLPGAELEPDRREDRQNQVMARLMSCRS